jgi:hypothetical protein
MRAGSQYDRPEGPQAPKNNCIKFIRTQLSANKMMPKDYKREMSTPILDSMLVLYHRTSVLLQHTLRYTPDSRCIRLDWPEALHFHLHGYHPTTTGVGGGFWNDWFEESEAVTKKRVLNIFFYFYFLKYLIIPSPVAAWHKSMSKRLRSGH